MDDDEIYNLFLDLRDSLYGLPFSVIDRTKDAGHGPFFDICHNGVDGEPEPALGFIAFGYTDGGWFGGYFCHKSLSPRMPNVKAALVWVLNRYIDTVIGK